MEPFACDALPGRVVFGAGAARTALAGEVARLGVSRLLLIPSGSERSAARELTAPLADRIAAHVHRGPAARAGGGRGRGPQAGRCGQAPTRC